MFPIRLGEVLNSESFSPPLFDALCSPNLKIAAKRINRHKPLIGPMSLGVREEKGVVMLT